MKMEHSVPKRRHIKYRCRGITQKKTYNIQNMVIVWNQEFMHLPRQTKEDQKTSEDSNNPAET